MSDGAGELPEVVRRYLSRAVAPEARWIRAVDVDISGRIKLRSAWYEFSSSLEVEALSAFRWSANVHRGLVSFSGHDAYQKGHGEMFWNLYGVIPVVSAEDEDVSHSARGRAALEQVFLPSALASEAVRWSETPDGWARASFTIDGEEMALELDVGPEGELRAVRMQRWSEAEGPDWHFVTFGAEVVGEVSAHGLTVPRMLKAGWFYGTPRWEDGCFFEGEVTALRIGAPEGAGE
ncbi:MAG TPA: hypothetical protein PKA64_18440 [Myxococcota bacterium]|nr:hypothetical protein [Myxococcota bacterium]